MRALYWCSYCYARNTHEYLGFSAGLDFETKIMVKKHAPGKKEKVLNRIRAVRGGKLNDPRFGARMRGEGVFAEQISRIFHVARRKAGPAEDGPELSTAAFRRPQGAQLGLGL
jgi:hypothetical protein